MLVSKHGGSNGSCNIIAELVTVPAEVKVRPMGIGREAIGENIS